MAQDALILEISEFYDTKTMRKQTKTN